MDERENFKDTRILAGIGTGPGDPRYLTLGQVSLIKDADVIFVPENKGKTRALDTIRHFIENQEIIYLKYPMGEVNEEIYKKNADIIENSDFKKAVFITIGDAMVYSTFYNTARVIKAENIRIISEPGIPSYLGAFNRTMIPMVLKGESFLLTDGNFKEEMLGFIDSIAILKTDKEKERYLNLLEKHGFSYIYVKRLSDEEEEILRDRDKILACNDYISLIIGRKNK